MIGAVVSSDSEDSDDDQGGTDAMQVTVQGRLGRDVPKPTQVQNAIPVQGRLIKDVLEDATIYIHG